MSDIVRLNLPSHLKVIGSLRDGSRVCNLLQDMLSIEFPGNTYLDVGWYPDLQPNGEYLLTVFQNDYDHHLEPKFRSKDVNQIEDEIYRLVAKYS